MLRSWQYAAWSCWCQCYTDYIIFITACMPRSWQYAAWSCWWLFLYFNAILIILFLSQRVCQDPGGMRPVLGISSCYVSMLYWLYYFYRRVYAKNLVVCCLSCWWQLLCFSAILIRLFLSQCVCQDPGSMLPYSGIGSCYVAVLWLLSIVCITACTPRSLQYAARSCWWQLLCFSAIPIILF
jgi:hypothetical protein